MDVHEFQAKRILQTYHIPVSEFFVISNLNELETILQTSGLKEVILKIQIHAGGRGKAGGIKFARNREEILLGAKELLGKRFINNQTGPQGLVSHQLLMTAPIDIAKEYYLAVLTDRRLARNVLIASPSGGMDIEQVAETSPEKILRLPIPVDGRLRSYHLLRLVKFMGWQGKLVEEGSRIAANLVKAFIETDASLLEVNPLVETKSGELIALDTKLSIDDNALFRHPELKALFDPTQISAQEARAHEHELAYVALDGDIGCMVNGAGLAMATMDIIQLYGGRPANFLDVGGSATKEKIAEGFKIILSDPQVKAVLVNIFGGIMNCETIALGIIDAARELHIKTPLIVRMEGTNVEKGKQLLQESNINLVVAKDLSEAAQKSVEEAYVNSHQ